MSTLTTEARRAAPLAGGLLAVGAAMLFASKGLFAKALYQRGVDYQTLTLMRGLLALPLYWGLAASRGFGAVNGPLLRQPPGLLWLAALAGVLSFGVGSLLDFRALELIDASMERALLFSYPALVVLFTAWRRRSWPAAAVGWAVLLTYAGICLVVGGFDAAAWRDNAVGALLVLGCALTYAAYFLAGERCIPVLGGLGFTLIAMSSAAGLLVAQFLATRSLVPVADIDGVGWMLLGALAVLCMFLPSLMQAEGIRRIGAVRGAILGSVGPPTTMLLGVALLQERVDAAQLLGTALIVLGVIVIGRHEARG